MSSSRQGVKPSGDPPSVGRIVPVNMPLETKGLNYDSLLCDLTTANDRSQQHFDCSFWA